LLIADEPTTALDVTIQAQVLDLLADIQRRQGMGMLLITHDLGVVARMAHRVGVMYAGEVVETGARGAFFEAPLHPYSRKLFAALPGAGKRGMHSTHPKAVCRRWIASSPVADSPSAVPPPSTAATRMRPPGTTSARSRCAAICTKG
jgi:ABC-type dipeptide/oligopeptide/nickel transport system, ATPase component